VSLNYRQIPMKILFRKIHRWLGLLMALQIIAWMASGLWFSLYPIEEIRGEHLAVGPPALALRQSPDDFAGLPSASSLREVLDTHFEQPWTLRSASLIRRDGQILWRVAGEHADRPFTRLVGAGGVLPPMTRDAAVRQAQDWVLEPGELRGVELLEHAAPDSEVRGRPLPVWKVSFEGPESLNLYLDPWTGEMLARRTDRWRVFDFLWMLHIMDFQTRDDFHHPLLQIAAALGLIVALGGVVLWALTTPVFRSRPRVR
jgi:uncharacterized iron-regulated membrane protein